MTNKNTQTKLKKFGKFSINLTTSFDNADSNKIFLNISVNKILKDLLKDVSIETETDVRYGEANLKRYQVKSWVYNALYSDYKGYLFLKDLLDSGKAKVGFDSTDRIESVIGALKRTLKEVVQVVNDYSDIKTTINVEVKAND